MKRLLFVWLFVLVSGPVAWAQEDALAAVPRISQAELKKLLADRKVLLVDVRDADSFAIGHIPGAVSMPLPSLADHLARLRAEKRPIVTYCA